MNSGGQWQLLPDSTDQEYVLKNFIEKGREYNDPRRPDLIMYYIKETERRAKLAEQGLLDAEAGTAERPASLDLASEASSSQAPLQLRQDAKLKVRTRPLPLYLPPSCEPSLSLSHSYSSYAGGSDWIHEPAAARV